MDFGTFQGVGAVFDLDSSEGSLFFTIGLLDGVHGIVLALLGSDLLVKFLYGVSDGGQWSTSRDLRLDLGEERSVRELRHGLQSLGLDGRGSLHR